MTTKTDMMLQRLDEVLAQLEALGVTGPTPTPASVNPNGTPGAVAPGELVESAWGNAVANTVARTAWTGVTFQNSWTNAGGATQNTQYRKHGEMVEVRISAGTGASGTVAFTLPIGFRPPADIRFPLDGAGAHAVATVAAATGAVALAGTANITGGFTFSVTA